MAVTSAAAHLVVAARAGSGMTHAQLTTPTVPPIDGLALLLNANIKFANLKLNQRRHEDQKADRNQAHKELATQSAANGTGGLLYGEDLPARINT